MAMFGNAFRPRGFVGEIEPGSAPAVDAMGIMPGDQPFPPQMRPGGGMFGRIGKRVGGFADRLSNPGKLGQLGAYLMAASGNPLGEAMIGMQQQRREDEELDILREYRRAQAANLTEPDYQNVPGVGLVKIERGKAPSVAVAAQPEKTGLIREMEAAGIDPKSEEGRMIIARAAKGYNYSGEAQEQRIATERAIAEARAAATAANRAPTGALTEMQKAELRAQANRAIQAGGDRAAIEARLRQMGVN